MVRSNLLPPAAAAAFVWLTAHAALAAPLAPIPSPNAHRSVGAPTAETFHSVTLWNEALPLGMVPPRGVQVVPSLSSSTVARVHNPQSVEADREEASEPSVLVMILASLGMIGFIAGRRYGAP